MEAESADLDSANCGTEARIGLGNQAFLLLGILALVAGGILMKYALSHPEVHVPGYHLVRLIEGAVICGIAALAGLAWELFGLLWKKFGST